MICNNSLLFIIIIQIINIIVRKQKTGLDDVNKEIAIMKKLNHKNVIKLFEIIENPEIDKIYLGI